MDVETTLRNSVQTTGSLGSVNWKKVTSLRYHEYQLYNVHMYACMSDVCVCIRECLCIFGVFSLLVFMHCCLYCVQWSAMEKHFVLLLVTPCFEAFSLERDFKNKCIRSRDVKNKEGPRPSNEDHCRLLKFKTKYISISFWKFRSSKTYLWVRAT